MTSSTPLVEIIKAMILDFQEYRPEPGVGRHVSIEVVPGKATVVVGVRRSGKSTYLFQVMQRLYSDGVSPQDVLHVNFFDDRLHNRLNDETFGSILEAYYSLYPEKKNSRVVHVFFDEIQVAIGWERFVDRLLRTERCQVYLSGSSAKMLSKEIATQMRGRALSWEMFPFSFREFLDYKGLDGAGIQHAAALSTKKRLLVQRAFDEYWQTGGFPETVGVNKNIRIKIHQEYFHATLFRDLIERHDVSHPKAVTDLGHWLADNAASLYSVNSLTGYLKSLGHKAPKTSVSEYLEWFEDAYFFFTVRIFDSSLARSNTNPKKAYCIDHALVQSVSSGIMVNSGHLLENIVFLALRRRHTAIFYYKTKTNKEVDFVVPTSPRLLVQVCETLVQPHTRTREIEALQDAMRELSVTSAYIVTRSESELLQVDTGTIEVLPVWRFLLDTDGFGSSG